MLKVACFVSIFLFHFITKNTSSLASKIDADVSSRLEKGEKVNIVVSFKDSIKPTLDAAKALRHADRGSRNKAIVEALEKHTENSQKGVIQTFSTRRSGEHGFKYFAQYWTSNTLFVKEADATTVKTIEEDPQVSRIQIEPVLELPDFPSFDTPVQRSGGYPVSDHPIGGPLWNLPKIQVAEAHAELGGNQGEGVVVGIIDTGVRWDHDTLKDNFVGKYGWYDGVTKDVGEPFDNNGHGTFCLGVMAGKGIGVAPGAKWMACRGCSDTDCSYEYLMNCLQFMACPTLAQGADKDCSKAPHVLSFSINGERAGSPFVENFLILNELGVISVVAAGNYGPFCGTTRAPGNERFVISVGGTTFTDYHYPYGSVGPAPNGDIKPDIVAPGENIYSADFNTADQLTAQQGTSAACPHVAGVVALLHVRYLDLTFEEAYDFLTKNTDQDIMVFTGYWCKQKINVIPNNFFGYGRVNAFKAVKAQTAVFDARKRK